MDASFEQHLNAARNWAREAHGAGWLSDQDVASLDEVENRSPASLFDAQTHRPLVVAFFGGTGVGKSALLNRLAGQEIARSGVERPTSREVSIFLHESLHIRQLPGDFPMERVRSAYHRDESRRQVLWIDMPDIDSTEESNRHLVMEWLPHIDILIYVVSPERYRDDKGWRLLRSHGRDHAWLFVMNQWDRGHQIQMDDFAALLTAGGFASPLILRCDCRPSVEQRKPDDFAQLQHVIQSLADSHVVQQLEHRARFQRQATLKACLETCLAHMGQQHNLRLLRQTWAEIWFQTQTNLLRNLEWPIREIAKTYVRHEGNPLLKTFRLEPTTERNAPDEIKAVESGLWDDWAQLQLQDTLDRLLVETGAAGMAATPIKSGLQRISQNAQKVVLIQANQSLRVALANPGNALQRFLLRATGVLEFVLPLAAAGWVTYDVVMAYYQNEADHSGYLGLDFAIHSGLLVAVAWLFPYLLHRRLTPSTEAVAIKGLRGGVMEGLSMLEAQSLEALDHYESKWNTLKEAGQQLLAAPVESPPPVPSATQRELLERMLPDRSVT